MPVTRITLGAGERIARKHVYGGPLLGGRMNSNSSWTRIALRSLVRGVGRFRAGRLVALAAAATALHSDLSAAQSSARERWETLQAIHWVENPRNSPRPGPLGELGAYQFRQSTWQMHTDLPFSYARERAHSDEVAVKHYEWLRRGFLRKGVEPTPYRIALAWNAGLTATLRGAVPSRSHDYARQVTNLVESLRSQRVTDATP